MCIVFTYTICNTISTMHFIFFKRTVAERVIKSFIQILPFCIGIIPLFSYLNNLIVYPYVHENLIFLFIREVRDSTLHSFAINTSWALGWWQQYCSLRRSIFHCIVHFGTYWWVLPWWLSGLGHCNWLFAVSHHCLGSNQRQIMWEGCQWLENRQRSSLNNIGFL